jgi:hypothetical protein
MSAGALDPLIHDPERLRIVATLAALPDGDALTVTRLQDMIGLPPGSPIIRLRELGSAGSAGPDDALGPGHLGPKEAGKATPHPHAASSASFSAIRLWKLLRCSVSSMSVTTRLSG